MPGFSTNQIHAGAAPDSATGARQVPIYQVSTSCLKLPDPHQIYTLPTVDTTESAGMAILIV